MTTGSFAGTIELIERARVFLWTVSLVFYGLGDTLTTYVGLEQSYIVEVGPVAGPVIREYHVLGMVGLKSVVFGLCVGMYVLAPKPFHVGVPLGLAGVGVVLTVWNSLLLVPMVA